MALAVSQLEADLRAIMAGPDFPQTGFDAGTRWARAYASYAAGAQSVSGDSPPSLAANESALGALLGAAFSNPSGDPSQTAGNIAAALTAFWFSPPVVFTGPPVSAIVTAVAGTAVLQAALLSLWASILAAPDPDDPAGQAAHLHAAALDVFTRTVVVSHFFPPPVPPVVAPIL